MSLYFLLLVAVSTIHRAASQDVSEISVRSPLDRNLREISVRSLLDSNLRGDSFAKSSLFDVWKASCHSTLYSGACYTGFLATHGDIQADHQPPKIGKQLVLESGKTFDPLAMKTLPDTVQKECNGTWDSVQDELDRNMMKKLDSVGIKPAEEKWARLAPGWTDKIKCIPKGAVGSGGIAPDISASAREGLVALYQHRVVDGNAETLAKPAGWPAATQLRNYKLHQVPVPPRRFIDHGNFSAMTIVDLRQLTVPARIITCHSMANQWVCHAPTGTYVYALKVRVPMGNSAETEIVDFNMMCHDGTPEEHKEETACHVMGPGGIAIYPSEYGTGASSFNDSFASAPTSALLSAAARPAAALRGNAEASHASQTEQNAAHRNIAGVPCGSSSSSAHQAASSVSNIVYLGVGWVLASVSIAIGFHMSRRTSSASIAMRAIRDAESVYV